MSEIEPEEVELEGQVRPRTMATWQVIAFSLFIGAAYVVGSTVAVIVIVVSRVAKNPGLDIDQLAIELETDGFVFAICSICGAVLSIPATMLLSRYQQELSATEYLALRNVNILKCLVWATVCIALLLVSDGITYLLGREVVPQITRQLYTSNGALPLLWVALMVSAPLSEELLFRGFLFTGLQASRLGTIGTAVLTSLLWAAIHVQYDLYQMSIIFLGGLVLSYVRVRTGSIVPCIFIHSLVNLVAIIQVAIVTSEDRVAAIAVLNVWG